MTRFLYALTAVLCLAVATTAEAGKLNLAWDANPETNVTGYRIHYGTVSRTYTTTVDVGNRTTFSLTGLADGKPYFIAVVAYNSAGLTSNHSTEVTGYPSPELTLTGLGSTNILLGQGTQTVEGGWFAIRGGAEFNFAANAWGRLPWPSYNSMGGSMRMATGDVDGDGADEVIIGLGPGSNGWVAVLDDPAHGYTLLKWIQVSWPAYVAANGEVFPAVGNLDADNAAEIVLGFGDGGKGFYQVLDDSAQGYRHLAWGQVPWEAYNAGPGPTHPAIGDVDGDGRGEIVVGLGAGSSGWIQVANNAVSNFSHRAWIQVNWAGYHTTNGETFPAAGDVDGDGRAEIVAGLGRSSDGWFEILDDAQGGYVSLKWDRVSWSAYNTFSGEVHPAVGNVDGDARAEIVIGLGNYPANGGWFEIHDDAAAGYASKGWNNVGWPALTTGGGGLFPAIAKR